MKNLSSPHTIQHKTPKKEQIVFYQACQKFQNSAKMHGLLKLRSHLKHIHIIDGENNDQTFSFVFWAQFTNPTCWWKSDIGGFTKNNFTQNIMVLDLNSSI
jgi:hypothetical protein